VARERLDVERVASLLAPRCTRPETAPARAGLVDSAVLVPLLPVAGEAGLLFIRRAGHLSDHAGQVSFPGGLREPGDASLYATALRESVEEVGVDADAARRIGALPPVTTLEKYRIHPFLGVWPEAAYGPASPVEVARVFTVPLAALLDPASEAMVEVSVGDRDLQVPAFLCEGEIIWGATRRITLDLLARLRGALDGSGAPTDRAL
jgi:8-oxo-dGTP pyrophosphatase MutT (NUDIX family)